MIWIFWFAAALVAYTSVGYLAWLRFRLLWRSYPVLHGVATPTISVVMVVRNEERVLESKLENLLSLDYPPDRVELIVVSDGSSDRTEPILHQYAREARVHAIVNPLPKGKAGGLNDALAVAQGEIVLFTDARQKIDRSAVRLLAENFADPDVGCVSGELMLGDPESGESGRGLGLYWLFEKQVRELESASGSVVGATGALYAARRELLTPVPAGTILDDLYLPMQIVRRGKRVVFDQRAIAWDSLDLGIEREFSRKVRTLSGNYQLVQFAPWLLGRENPIRLEFISHKLLRLTVPAALAALLLVSPWLKAPFYKVIFVAQVIFYALSLISLARLARRGMLARVADAAGAFVLLNSAAVVALANFISGKRAAWR